jgi:hypothetical protein
LQLAIRDESVGKPDIHKSLDLSICMALGVQVTVLVQETGELLAPVIFEYHAIFFAQIIENGCRRSAFLGQ